MAALAGIEVIENNFPLFLLREFLDGKTLVGERARIERGKVLVFTFDARSKPRQHDVELIEVFRFIVAIDLDHHRPRAGRTLAHRPILEIDTLVLDALDKIDERMRAYDRNLIDLFDRLKRQHNVGSLMRFAGPDQLSLTRLLEQGEAVLVRQRLAGVEQRLDLIFLLIRELHLSPVLIAHDRAESPALPQRRKTLRALVEPGLVRRFEDQRAGRPKSPWWR